MRARDVARLPRASGDRPAPMVDPVVDGRSAPRERGSTPSDQRGAGGAGVCPARAGIDPRACTSSAIASGLPRASGDRPLPEWWRPEFPVSAPRERGSTLPVVAPVRGVGVCPARAGIDPNAFTKAACFSGLPRASGDRPGSKSPIPRWRTSAPRERGSTQMPSQRPPVFPVCPARAGIDLARSHLYRDGGRLPRASGDRPANPFRGSAKLSSAPRERGSTRATRPRSTPSAVCPARAGIDPNRSADAMPAPRLPRASGDRPRHAAQLPVLAGSAPRERGSTLTSKLSARTGGVCPARAGIDRTRVNDGHDEAGLPRASGDRPAPVLGADLGGGSAPRERGSTSPKFAREIEAKVCPARAGIDLSLACAVSLLASLPRASGDRPPASCANLRAPQSAPRERGSTRPCRLLRRWLTVCPARAGIDLSRRCWVHQSRGLPRASGDRPSRWKRASAPLMSAPRERGSTLAGDAY